jgi:hypothetical protein
MYVYIYIGAKSDLNVIKEEDKSDLKMMFSYPVSILYIIYYIYINI